MVPWNGFSFSCLHSVYPAGIFSLRLQLKRLLCLSFDLPRCLSLHPILVLPLTCLSPSLSVRVSLYRLCLSVSRQESCSFHCVSPSSSFLSFTGRGCDLEERKETSNPRAARLLWRESSALRRAQDGLSLCQFCRGRPVGCRQNCLQRNHQSQSLSLSLWDTNNTFPRPLSFLFTKKQSSSFFSALS